MAALNTGSFRAFLEGEVTKVGGMLNDLKEDEVWPKFIRSNRTQKETIRVQGMENMPSASRVPEGSVAPLLDFDMGYSQAYTQHTWGAQARFTQEMQTFAQVELMDRMARLLPTATHKVREIIAAAYLEYGDDASAVPSVGGIPLVNVLGGDGLAMFHAAHTFRSGTGTWSNLSAASLDLTEANVNTIRILVRRWVDNTGAPLDIDTTRLIIPPDLFLKMSKITRSTLEPGSAQNAINTVPLMLQGGQTVENPWLSDTADWYVETDADAVENGPQFYFGWEDQVQRYEEKKTRCHFIQITFSLAHGVLAGRKLVKAA